MHSIHIIKRTEVHLYQTLKRPTLCDIVENNVVSVTQNAAPQSRTVKVKAVQDFLSGIIVEYSQITGNYEKRQKED